MLKTTRFLVLFLALVVAIDCGRKTSHVAATLNAVEASKTAVKDTIETAYLYRITDLKRQLDAGEITKDELDLQVEKLDAKLDSIIAILDRIQDAEGLLASTAQLYRTNPTDPTVGAQINELIAQVTALTTELYAQIGGLNGGS